MSISRQSGVALIGISIISFLSLAAVSVLAQSLPAICSVHESLSQGDESTDVTTLQTFLIGQGYSIPDGPTDYFGAETESALVAFQNATGITAAAGGNGLFGSFTMSYISSHFCQVTNYSTSTNTSSSNTFTTPGILIATPSSGPAPLTVTFADVGESIAYGDGIQQSSSNGSAIGTITHTYNSVGTYIAESNGLASTITVGGSTSSGTATSSSPAGSIAAPSSTGPAPLAVTFYVSCVNASAYDIVFGDNTDLGANSSNTKCDGSLQAVTHTYNATGTYAADLELFVPSSSGTFSTQQEGSVTVTATGATSTTATSTSTGGGTTATTTASTNPGCVALLNSNISENDTDATTNGDVSRLQEFLAGFPAIYPSALITGFYGSLTAQAVQNFTSTYNTPVECNSMGFTVTPSSGPAPLSVTLSAQNIDELYFLNFGDGSKAGSFTSINCGDGSENIGANASSTSGGDCTYSAAHTYQNPGSYIASLEFGTTTGRAVGIAQVTVSSSTPSTASSTSPTASSTVATSLTASPTSGAAPLTVNFGGSASSTSYSLSFGDGSTPATVTAQSSPITISQSHTYQSPGTYAVVLSVNGTAAASTSISVSGGSTVGTSTNTQTSTGGVTANLEANDTSNLTVYPPAGHTSLNYNYILTWSSTNATACTLVGTDTNGTQTFSVPINGSTPTGAIGKYVLTCTGPTGQGTDSVTITSSTGQSCVAPTQQLTYGNSDSGASGQVTVLQTFLAFQGVGVYPSQQVTGFFGNDTMAAVEKFQGLYGIAQTGNVGPLTLAAMTGVCNGSYLTNKTISNLTASPSSGNPPLSVTFTGSELDTPQNGAYYTVNFGDGSSNGQMTGGSGTYTVSHTYSSNGTYTAILYQEQNLCSGISVAGCLSDLQVGQTTVTVGNGVGGSGTGSSGQYTTYYTFVGGGLGGGANFDSTNPNDSSANAGYCLSGGSAIPCPTPTPSSSFNVFATQQSGTIPLYEVSQNTNCNINTGSLSGCAVNAASTNTAICPSGWASGYQATECPPPDGAPGNVLGYVYPVQYVGTLPLYSIANSCAGSYFMTTSPSNVPQDATGGCGVANQVLGIIGYAPLPTAPTGSSASTGTSAPIGSSVPLGSPIPTAGSL